MNIADIVIDYMSAAERGDWQTFAKYLSDDFIFESTPVVQARTEFLSATKGLWGAFSDRNFHLRVDRVDDNMVYTTFAITGVHTGILISPMPSGLLVINPTNKHISLSENGAEYTVMNGKIVHQYIQPNPNSGWPGIVKQLGVQDSI